MKNNKSMNNNNNNDLYAYTYRHEDMGLGESDYDFDKKNFKNFENTNKLSINSDKVHVKDNESLINSMRSVEKFDKYDDYEYRIKKPAEKSPKELNTSKTSSLKNEIDNLDQEIKQLQNKLKVMIDVNKK